MDIKDEIQQKEWISSLICVLPQSPPAAWLWTLRAQDEQLIMSLGRSLVRVANGKASVF